MEIEERVRLDSDSREFLIMFNGGDLRSVSQAALVDQLAKMVDRIIDKLAEEFLAIHREDLLRRISVVEVMERVKEKAGDEFVKAILEKRP